jgi:hypothetical protein
MTEFPHPTSFNIDYHISKQVEIFQNLIANLTRDNYWNAVHSISILQSLIFAKLNNEEIKKEYFQKVEEYEKELIKNFGVKIKEDHGGNLNLLVALYKFDLLIKYYYQAVKKEYA